MMACAFLGWSKEPLQTFAYGVQGNAVESLGALAVEADEANAIVSAVTVPTGDPAFLFLDYTHAHADFSKLLQPVRQAVYRYRTINPIESGVEKTLGRIAHTAYLEDDEEQPPTTAVIDQTSNLIRGASLLMRTPMLEGIVSTFYGEINVTWRTGDKIVRIACFPGRPSILQFGNLSQPLGSYQSQQNPNAQDLKTRLDALNDETA
jgi:hypothetical protein